MLINLASDWAIIRTLFFSKKKNKKTKKKSKERRRRIRKAPPHYSKYNRRERERERENTWCVLYAPRIPSSRRRFCVWAQHKSELDFFIICIIRETRPQKKGHILPLESLGWRYVLFAKYFFKSAVTTIQIKISFHVTLYWCWCCWAFERERERKTTLCFLFSSPKSFSRRRVEKLLNTLLSACLILRSH